MAVPGTDTCSKLGPRSLPGVSDLEVKGRDRATGALRLGQGQIRGPTCPRCSLHVCPWSRAIGTRPTAPLPASCGPLPTGLWADRPRELHPPSATELRMGWELLGTPPPPRWPSGQNLQLPTEGDKVGEGDGVEQKRAWQTGRPPEAPRPSSSLSRAR